MLLRKIDSFLTERFTNALRQSIEFSVATSLHEMDSTLGKFVKAFPKVPKSICCPSKISPEILLDIFQLVFIV